jgi:acetoin utilization deacetylase AcuC-like enzyme
MNNLYMFYPTGHEAHIDPGHPESPERVKTVRRALEDAGWWQLFPKLEPLDLSLDFLKTVHKPNYIDWLPDFCQRGENVDGDTYTTPASWRLALNAAGGAAAIAEAVWKLDPATGGSTGRGFALTRPPGHHATRAIGMGFCLLNNIAIAAEYLLSHPMKDAPNARRLAIVDLDLHHGNGTQDIFWQRGEVLFISTHQSPLYPGSGSLEETGAGAGAGFTVNLPFPPGTGDAGYRAAMDQVILPLLDRFQPDMLLVDCGFDPHWRDPLGHLLLSAAGYGGLIQSLVDWADKYCHGRIALFLEGGYDTQALAACTLSVTAALLGEPITDALGPSPRPEGKSWQPVVERAKSIWRL